MLGWPCNRASRFRKEINLKLLKDTPGYLIQGCFWYWGPALNPYHSISKDYLLSREHPYPCNLCWEKHVWLPQLCYWLLFPCCFFTVCSINIPTLIPKVPKKTWGWWYTEDVLVLWIPSNQEPPWPSFPQTKVKFFILCKINHSHSICWNL